MAFQLMQLLSSSPSTHSQPIAASKGRVPGHLASQAGKAVTSRAQVGAGGGKGWAGEGAGGRGGEMAMRDAAGGSGDSEWMPDITKQQHYLYHRRGDSAGLDFRSNGAATSAAERRPPDTPGGGTGQNHGISDGGAALLNLAPFTDLQDYVKEFGQHMARKRVQHVRDNLPEVAARVGSILFIIPCRDIDDTSVSAASSSDQSLAATWRKVVASMASHKGWMQRQHVGPLPPNSLEQVKVELTMEAYLTRASLSNVADLRESLDETFASTGDLSSTSKEPPPTPTCYTWSTPAGLEVLLKGTRISLAVCDSSTLLSISAVACLVANSRSSPFRISSPQTHTLPSSYPRSPTYTPHPLTHIISACLQGGGFLVEACQEMVPHSKADCPYGVCRCRQWVPSSDTAVVLVSTAEDMQGCPPSTSKSVPPPAAAASPSAAAGGSAVEGQPREPVVVVFRVRLDKIRVEAEQHNDKIAMVRDLFPPGKVMIARVFYRWRLQTVVARGYSDEAIFAAYESLQRAKAQVAVQLQEAGTLHQVAVKVALLPFSCSPDADFWKQRSGEGSWGEPTPTSLPSSRLNSSSGRSRVSFRDAAEDDVESEDEKEEAQGGERWSGKRVGGGKADGSEFGPRVRRTGGGKRLSIGELPVDGSEADTDSDEDNERGGKRVSLDDSPLDILGPSSEWHSHGAPREGMREMRTRGRSRDGGEKDGRGEGCRVYSMSGWRERRRGWQGSSGEGEVAGSDATSEVWKLQAELGCGMVIMSIEGVSFGSVIMQRVKVDLTSQPDAVDVDLTVGDLDVVDMLANSKHYAHIFEPNGDLPSLNLVVRQNMVLRGPNLPAKPQVCVFVESQQTRITAIFRFFNDFALFVERMAPIFSPPQASGASKEIRGSAKGQDAKRERSKQGEGKAAGDSEGGDAPPLVFLHISDLSLCLPVSSWSEESLDVRVETINLIVPTPASQRLSQHTLLRLATGIRPQDPSFWKPLVDALDRSPPSCPDSVGIQLSRFGAYWSPSKTPCVCSCSSYHLCPLPPSPDPCLLIPVRSLAPLPAMPACPPSQQTITPKVERNIISESGVFISVQSNPSRVHVHWPQVEIRLGPTQYNAIMTLIFQNLAEGCSFTDDQVHNPQVGRPLGGEAAPPDPCISLAGLTPGLEIQLDFGRAVIHAEMEHPATLVENGFGDPLLSLRAHRLTIVYSDYTDFSQVTVKAFRLLLVDDRFLKFSQSELALVETNSSRAKPSPTSASTSTRLSTPQPPSGRRVRQGLGCDLDRSFLVNVVMKQGHDGRAGGDFDLLLPVPEESLINVCPPPSSSQHSSPRCTDPPLATLSPITADSPAFHSAQSRMPPPSTPPRLTASTMLLRLLLPADAAAVLVVVVVVVVLPVALAGVAVVVQRAV
ncbi:unnamed protein product [Closterium sp. Naga37s-1]|nr:unnamed protein product [Closterium sp. Naga37s-1]